jgi:hypothetical protein
MHVKGHPTPAPFGFRSAAIQLRFSVPSKGRSAPREIQEIQFLISSLSD